MVLSQFPLLPNLGVLNTCGLEQSRPHQIAVEVFREFSLSQYDSCLAALLVGFTHFTCLRILLHLLEASGLVLCAICLGSSLRGMDWSPRAGGSSSIVSKRQEVCSSS